MGVCGDVCLDQLRVDGFEMFSSVALCFGGNVGVLVKRGGSKGATVVSTLHVYLKYNGPSGFVCIRSKSLRIGPRGPSRVGAIVRFSLVFRFKSTSVRERYFCSFVSRSGSGPSGRAVRLRLGFVRRGGKGGGCFGQVV